MDRELGGLLQALAAGRWRVAVIGAGEATALIEQAVPPGALVLSTARSGWHEALTVNAPFDLIFIDGGAEDPQRLVELLAPGGVVVAPPEAFWLEHPELYAVELRELGIVFAARQARASASS